MPFSLAARTYLKEAVSAKLSPFQLRPQACVEHANQHLAMPFPRGLVCELNPSAHFMWTMQVTDGQYWICHYWPSLPENLWPAGKELYVAIIMSEVSQSVQSLSHIWRFATPWTVGRQASLSITNSQSLLKLTSIELVMPSNFLILCPLKCLGVLKILTF